VPSLPSLSDWQTEYQWVLEERRRLEAYTVSQFALIKQQREELLGRRAGIEETLALREQELNRQLRLLAEGSETQEKRNRELAEREAALAAQMETWAAARQELQALQQINSTLQTENEAQRILAEELRIQVAHLQEAVRAGRSELAVIEQVVRRRQQAAEEERGELAAARRQLEQRFAALEKAEESFRRRTAEIDQLEVQIRLELEQREQQVALEHKELEKARAKLRQHPPTRAPQGAGPIRDESEPKL
jgi:chromosome segregation ATPase